MITAPRYMLLATALSLAAGAFSAEPEKAVPAAASAPTSREWKIKGDSTTLYPLLAVSASGRFLAYGIADPGNASPAFRCYAMDTQTTQPTDLLALLNAAEKTEFTTIANVAFSEDGNWLAVVAEKAGRCTAFLVTLADKKVQKLGQAESIGAFWGGDKLYLSVVDEMTLGPVLQVDPATGKVIALKLSGALVGATSDGKWLLCVCDPNNPARPLSSAEYQKGIVYKVNSAGAVTTAICPAKEAFTGPQLSANNKYFVRSCSTPSFSEIAMHLVPNVYKVTSLEDGKKWEINGSGDLIGVSNTGEVIVIEPRRSVKAYCDPQSPPRGLVAARAATVAGDRVYYIAIDEATATVRSVLLPGRP